MISFTCTCGKSYQLPDRHAGREVRCNQCEKTLVVPAATQTEPVVPLDDQKQVQAAASNSPAKFDAGTDTPKKSLPIVPIAAAVLALVVGLVVGKMLPSEPLDQDIKDIASATNTNLSEELKAGAATLQQVIEEKSQELSARLEIPASDVAEVVKETDDAKRSEELAKIAESRQKDRNSAAMTEMQSRSVRFMTGLADHYREPGEKPIPYELFAGPEKPAFSVNDWRVGDRVPTAFAVKTLDGAPILLSIDGDPVAAGKKGDNVLDVVADAVKTEDEKVKDDQNHEKSFRIDSASREELRLLWPGEGKAGLSGEKIKEFRFSLYVPEKPNAMFKPGKPEGIDKTLVLSSIRLRLVADNGIIEYAPTDREHFVRIMERCRSGWLPIRIPLQGDETWKRTDFALADPLVVDRIELRAKPTGSGATLWIDNLAVVE